MSLVVLFGVFEHGKLNVYYELLDGGGRPTGPSILIPATTLPVDVIVLANKTPFGIVVLKQFGIVYDGDTTDVAFMRRHGLFDKLVMGSYQQFIAANNPS